jgi:hypothetical protein
MYGENLEQQSSRLVSALASSTAEMADALVIARQSDDKVYSRLWNLIRSNGMEIVLANIDVDRLDGQGAEGFCVLLQRKDELYPVRTTDKGLENIHRMVNSYFTERQPAIRMMLEKRGYLVAADGRSCVFRPNIDSMRPKASP